MDAFQNWQELIFFPGSRKEVSMASWVFSQEDLGEFSLGNIGVPKKCLSRTVPIRKGRGECMWNSPGNWNYKTTMDFCWVCLKEKIRERFRKGMEMLFYSILKLYFNFTKQMKKLFLNYSLMTKLSLRKVKRLAQVHNYQIKEPEFKNQVCLIPEIFPP